MLRSSSRRCLAPSRPRCCYASSALLLASDNASTSPGSSTPRQSPPHTPSNGEDESISDREWELRTGRAMDILQQTLPKFFSTGLVATNYHLPLHMDGLLGVGLGSLGKSKSREDERDSDARGDEEGIYARTIRLEYTPPVALPAPFPRMLSVEGLPLYVASSVFVRHTLQALYTDLAVAMHKVHVRSGPSAPPSTPGSSSVPPIHFNKSNTQPNRRERAITIGLLVSGAGRLGLSSERAEWDVNSTYTFCPRTGRIVLHTVNAIHPAPSETVYAAFQSTLAAIGSGLGAPSRQKGAAVNVARGEPSRR